MEVAFVQAYFEAKALPWAVVLAAVVYVDCPDPKVLPWVVVLAALLCVDWFDPMVLRWAVVLVEAWHVG